MIYLRGIAILAGVAAACVFALIALGARPPITSPHSFGEAIGGWLFIWIISLPFYGLGLLIKAKPPEFIGIVIAIMLTTVLYLGAQVEDTQSKARAPHKTDIAVAKLVWEKARSINGAVPQEISPNATVTKAYALGETLELHGTVNLSAAGISYSDWTKDGLSGPRSMIEAFCNSAARTLLQSGVDVHLVFNDDKGRKAVDAKIDWERCRAIGADYSVPPPKRADATPPSSSSDDTAGQWTMASRFDKYVTSEKTGGSGKPSISLTELHRKMPGRLTKERQHKPPTPQATQPKQSAPGVSVPGMTVVDGRLGGQFPQANSAPSRAPAASAATAQATQPKQSAPVRIARKQKQPGEKGWHRIVLPQGVSIELPSNWHVMDEKGQRLVEDLVQSTVRSVFTLTAPDKSALTSTLYSPSGKILAQASFRFYSVTPTNAITQAVIKQATSDDLNYLDAELRKGKEAGVRNMGGKIWGWQLPRKENVGEFLAIVSEHKARFAHEAVDRHHVRVRVYDGPLSFSLMLNYQDGAETQLRPIIDRIANSLARSRVVKRPQGVPSTKKTDLDIRGN